MKLLYLLVGLLLIIGVVNAGNVTTMRSGLSPINDKITIASTTASKSAVIADEMYKILSDAKYPLTYVDSYGQTITIKEAVYDKINSRWGVYLSATRGGKEVATHSPLWVVNAPTDVVISKVVNDARTGNETVTIRENLLVAAQQSVSDYVNTCKMGKAEGDDSLLIYTLDPEDGSVARSVPGTWASIIAGTGTAVGYTGTAEMQAYILASSVVNNWSYNYRPVMMFNTSSLPDTCTISAASVYMTGYSGTNQLGADTLMIVGYTPWVNGAIFKEDYNKNGTVAFSDNPALPTTGNVTFALTAAGLGSISKTGYTPLMVTMGSDFNSVNLTWVSGKKNVLSFRTASDNPALGRPFMVITYSLSVPVASYDIQLTDTSTNSPSTWQWNVTNLLTATPTRTTICTTQNCNMPLTPGNWLVELSVSNSAGQSTNKYNYTVGMNLTSPQVYFWNRTG
jgi:hypothetical protein